jgi:hypothetical protein
MAFPTLSDGQKNNLLVIGEKLWVSDYTTHKDILKKALEDCDQPELTVNDRVSLILDSSGS